MFEAYWAPLTEGKIGFWETVWFLFVSALWGATLTVKDAVALHGFQRWIFDKVHNYGVSWATLPLLAVTFAGVFGITAIMVAALAALTPNSRGRRPHAFFSASITAQRLALVFEIDALQTQFTSVLLAMLALGATIAATHGLGGRLASSAFLTRVARLLLIVLLVVVAFAAGLCGVALAGVTRTGGFDLHARPRHRLWRVRRLAAQHASARCQLCAALAAVPTGGRHPA